MEFTLPPEWEKRLAAKVARGEFYSVDEAIREGVLRLFGEVTAHQMVLEDIRAKIQAGVDEANRGEGMDGEEFMAELKEYIEELTKKPALT